MKTLLFSLAAAGYLYGAPGDPQTILNDVANLRAKYEECRQSQVQEKDAKIQGYRTRISRLEAQIEENGKELRILKQRNREIEQEISRKKGVIRSLEKTLTSRDEQFRAAVARNENLAKEANAIKVGKIERENLTRALAKAKGDVDRLENELKKTGSPAAMNELVKARTEAAKLRKELAAARSAGAKAAMSGASTDPQRLQALQRELDKANQAIAQLQNAAPAVREKVVTKVVEPTEKLAALQRELNAARAEIANLKNGAPRQTVKEKIVEKVVYRDRPIEKVVTKTIEPTEKIKALQGELAAARATIEKLKSGTSAPRSVEKVVYRDRIVTQEKVIYKEKPVEKVVYRDRPVVQEKVITKTLEPTEKLKGLQSRLAQAEAQISKLKADLAAAQRKKTAVAAAPIRDGRPAAKTAAAEPTKVSATPPKKGGSSAYRMAASAPIYNAPGGSVVDTWEARRSFTAGAPSGGWVHITGYFVNRVWQPTRDGENLWVRESDVIRR